MKKYFQQFSYPHLQSLLKGFQKAVLGVSGATIFFLMLFGSASASTVYLQNTDNTGSIAGDLSGGFDFDSLIGSFNSGAGGQVIGTSSVVEMTYLNPSGFCSSNVGAGVAISTNGSDGHSSYFVNSAQSFPGYGGGSYVTATSTFSSSYTLAPSTTYYVYSFVNCNNTAGIQVQSDSANINFYGYISQDGIGPTPPNTSNRLILVSPGNGSTTLSIDPTYWEIQYYASSSQISFAPTDLLVQFTETYPARQVINLDIPATTTDSLVTINSSTSLPYGSLGGAYGWTAQLVSKNICNSIISGFCSLIGISSQTTLISSNVQTFYLDANPYPDISTSTDLTLGDLLNPYSSSTQPTQDACQSISLVLTQPDTYGNFLYTIFACAFIPDSSQVSTLSNALNNSLLTYAPWGYVTKLYNDFSATSSTSTLPTLKLIIPPNAPGAGLSFDLTPWSMLAGTGTILATATSSVPGSATATITFIQATLPAWTEICYYLLGIWILLRLFVYFNGGGGASHPHSSQNKKS